MNWYFLFINEINNINSTEGLIVTGQKVINKGELVTPDRYQKLLSLKTQYEGRIWNSTSYYLVLFQ